MLNLRIKKLIFHLESIESKHEGIIISTLTNKDSDLYIAEHIQEIEKKKINQIIESIAKLTKSTQQEIRSRVLKKFSIAERQLVSTTTYGKIIGIDAKHCLFDFLLKKGVITKDNNKYKLTDYGMEYGDYLHNENGEQFIGWHKSKLDTITKELSSIYLEKLTFRLFHMTHISNLKGIMEVGILSHDMATDYLDISNHNVNSRRNKNDNPHKISLHKYVPLYFNPRNAMLFACQKKYGDNIVILEIDNEVISNDYTLFSEGNAARKDSKITTNKLDVKNFQWHTINSSTWTSDIDGINEDVKSLIMSECLILNKIETNKIINIHCQNELITSQLNEDPNIRTKAITNKDLFF
ncbi:DUF4433 domain-containing protein [Klebsiella pneumoniae]|uniref:DUF4433 domain-containing protein n=1 Tax=Enterobacteriaceae TaxID=543 RepID=UPI00081C8979|nr:DUF4433 domain-containing protein [Klebsiella pneumoniae]EIV2089329.1 DUF4433 domain-containing protein [Klebsiella pneumoniae subsp. ozaenae]AOA96892.1 hypothetical protein A8C02_16570 [Klebsiella pneumoniae]AWC98678.1 DUF4433 domain-containing protein [Klebsiella pneumoniae]AWD96394.1 DUF4433 domain-containing protein [Klebsiella pneumoniae]AWS83569.1 DUF4433 domain-containing protein [Klebsiella pneumoniae]